MTAEGGLQASGIRYAAARTDCVFLLRPLRPMVELREALTNQVRALVSQRCPIGKERDWLS